MDTPDWSSQTTALSDTRDRLTELNSLAGKFGSSLSKAFASGIAHGKSFDDILKNVGQKFIQIGLQSAFKPLETGVNSLVGSLTGSLGSMLGGGAGGGAGAGVPITPFADGGVISSPGYFPMGRGLGLAGEAGAEAILPLARGSDGTLGVSASGGGRGPVAVTVNIQTPDVEGFARSEAQISAALARAVARGRRGS